MSNVIADLGGSIKRDDLPDFRAGDTIKVHVKVVEGNRSRIQVFQGVVIRVQGSGLGRSFTVRIAHDEAELRRRRADGPRGVRRDRVAPTSRGRRW